MSRAGDEKRGDEDKGGVFWNYGENMNTLKWNITDKDM